VDVSLGTGVGVSSGVEVAAARVSVAVGAWVLVGVEVGGCWVGVAVGDSVAVTVGTHVGVDDGRATVALEKGRSVGWLAEQAAATTTAPASAVNKATILCFIGRK
jgi:hypothetical protein